MFASASALITNGKKKIASAFLHKTQIVQWIIAPLYLFFLVTVFVCNELNVNDKPNATVGVTVRVGEKDFIVRMPNPGEGASLQTI